LIVGGFYSEVAVQKREAEGTVCTKHQLNLDPNPVGYLCPWPQGWNVVAGMVAKCRTLLPALGWQGLKPTKKVVGHLVRKNKEPGWMATSSARTKSQSNRLTRRLCPCPSILIDNVPALRAYPSRSLEALGRLFRAKVILGRPRLG